MLAALALSLALPADPPLNVESFPQRWREARRSATKQSALEADLRRWFGDDIRTGANPRISQNQVVFALEADEAPQVVSKDGSFQLRLTRLGKTRIYAGHAQLKDGDGFLWSYRVGTKTLGGGALEVYLDDPDTKPQAGVARGEVRDMPRWRSQVFNGTWRDWWVYLPPRRSPSVPTAVMVFQDGQWMKNYVPTMFDNLIAKGDMPPTVGIFITPGTFDDNRSNRSFEYDTLSDAYARFLLDEILPEVNKLQPLRTDAAGRAICGMSSGGICSFTVAWERPNEFGKVLSLIGSFTNIARGSTNREGGHNYPALIRLTDRKPIRVLLQEGENDLDNQFGNWPLANLQMMRALEFKSYDAKLVWGKGAHNDRHARAKMPEMLRWLWRKEGAL